MLGSGSKVSFFHWDPNDFVRVPRWFAGHKHRFSKKPWPIPVAFPSDSMSVVRHVVNERHNLGNHSYDGFVVLHMGCGKK